ncbi:hypothetical protein IWT25_00722 [Secundilactobacillus pentosiphilus]|uniref:Uncharacterized protein n=1 Tax=Secundilactobacillus pentosiphilus TaxID=1714682 RepID=A0A1Z5IUX9_9LACO|nr:hypothetical protein [Secundilactobacillus pentosiphilus]GAX05418.1 hypothetical protein IWT25_00722 [Secundilactobacillus pentosiphilus]
MTCELCNGSGRIYNDLGYGVEIVPCPNCNKALRAEKQAEYEQAIKAVKTPAWVREAVAEILH